MFVGNIKDMILIDFILNFPMKKAASKNSTITTDKNQEKSKTCYNFGVQGKQKSTDFQALERNELNNFVGVAGFEPATLWSQTRCASRTAPYPEIKQPE